MAIRVKEKDLTFLEKFYIREVAIGLKVTTTRFFATWGFTFSGYSASPRTCGAPRPTSTLRNDVRFPHACGPFTVSPSARTAHPAASPA
jgi:hypothetical protein